MTTHYRPFVRPLVLAALTLCSLPSQAATPPALTVEYSADRTIETDSGDLQGRVHAAPGKERNETLMQGMSSILILRTDEKVGWLLMPAQKMYQELDFAAAAKQAGSVTPEQTEMELVGQEVVSGQATNKYKFVMKDKSGGGFLWYTDSGIPVKMDVLQKDGKDSTRMTVTLANIEIGAQDPALFEAPVGFNRMPNAGGLFGAMGGMPGMPGMGGDNGAVSSGGSDAATGGASGRRGGGFLGGLRDAVTRPVKNEAAAVADDVTNIDSAVTKDVEAAVADEVKEAGARGAVRGGIRSVTGFLRNR